MSMGVNLAKLLRGPESEHLGMGYNPAYGQRQCWGGQKVDSFSRVRVSMEGDLIGFGIRIWSQTLSRLSRVEHECHRVRKGCIL